MGVQDGRKGGGFSGIRPDPDRSCRRARLGRARTVVERAAPGWPGRRARVRQRLVAGLTSTVEHGPLVSIVMLNRDGAALLQRCLPMVLATSYRPIELIVVDNGSTDDSVAYIEGLTAPFPIRVIRSNSNHSFSDGNHQGAAATTGDWLLLLNNDVEPIDPRWLGYLIETGDARGAAAVGARLVYPRREPGDPGVNAFPKLTLQHGGIGLRMDDGMPIAVPLDAGGDALAADAGVVRDAVALTAACLLVRRSAFEAAAARRATTTGRRTSTCA